jgi:hypothetical protein
MGNAILYRMPSGVPGDVSRRSKSIIEPAVLDASKPFSAYGLPGKFVSGKLVPVEAGDAATVVAAFLVRPYPIQTGAADGSGVASAKIGDALRFGYMTVKNNAGTPAVQGQVYMRVANAAAGKPIGGIEAASTADTVAIPGCYFKDAGDASGNVEIEYKIA